MVVRPHAVVLLAGIGILPGQPAGLPLLPVDSKLPAHYGGYIPGTQQLEPTMWFPPSPTLAGLPGEGVVGLQQEEGADGFIGGTINSALLDPPDQTDVGMGSAGSALSVAAAPYGAAWYGCEQLPGQIQSGGEYWNGHAMGRFPAVFAVRARGDPVEEPAGDPSDLLAKGRAGAWCRPRPPAFANSSPLASRTFWVPVAILLTGVSLFLLSRGVRLP